MHYNVIYIGEKCEWVRWVGVLMQELHSVAAANLIPKIWPHPVHGALIKTKKNYFIIFVLVLTGHISWGTENEGILFFLS